MRSPPSSGPIATAPPTVEPHTAIALPRSRPLNSWAISARPVANIAEAPTPWSARARFSHAALGASPQRSEASVKIAIPTMKTRLRPKRSESAPLVSKSAARVIA